MKEGGEEKRRSDAQQRDWRKNVYPLRSVKLQNGFKKAMLLLFCYFFMTLHETKLAGKKATTTFVSITLNGLNVSKCVFCIWLCGESIGRE